MDIKIFETSKEMGKMAAEHGAMVLNEAIAKKGYARLLLSTGASQFDTLASLVQQDVDWSKVEMFHLDEYINLPESHSASFRKYLKERFVSKINLKAAYFVNGEGDIEANIKKLSEKILEAPIDLGIVGIGENTHIAFNDPPADFNTQDAYIVVNLDDACKRQQMGEGWFDTVDDVPKQAISMSVYQIMQCEQIISCVPYKVKAQAVKRTLEDDFGNMTPSTMLRMHPNLTLYLDNDSASLINK
jgi:glucosamine-6-phosphate deaminase